MTEEILSDYHDGKSGGSDVLLGACIDHAEFRDIDRLRENAGRHIGDKRDISGIGDIVKLRAVDGVVEADMDIVGIGTEILALCLRDIGIVPVLRGSDNADVSVLLAFFEN